MIYLDNAATSWPKPDSVLEAMTVFLRDVGANPGRSGHSQSTAAENVRFDAREALADLFGLRDPMRVIFSLNATAALNIALHGLLQPGDHVVTSAMEHNAVMRPLRCLERDGVSISLVRCTPAGLLDPDDVKRLIRSNTRLVVMMHASNVTGAVMPIREVGAIARAAGVPFLVDAAQTAGGLPINLVRDNIDLLAFAGHKSLLGPPGVGGLVMRDDFDIETLPPRTYGGTGSLSEHEVQPAFLPDKYEAGTPNAVGLAGLVAAVRFINQRGLDNIMTHERTLTKKLLRGLSEIDGVIMREPTDAPLRTAVISFNIDGLSASDVSQKLDERFQIMTRPGLHCAPAAHKTLGTFPDGMVRIAPSVFTAEQDVDRTLDAIAAVASEAAE